MDLNTSENKTEQKQEALKRKRENSEEPTKGTVEQNSNDGERSIAETSDNQIVAEVSTDNQKYEETLKISKCAEENRSTPSCSRTYRRGQRRGRVTISVYDLTPEKKMETKIANEEYMDEKNVTSIVDEENINDTEGKRNVDNLIPEQSAVAEIHRSDGNLHEKMSMSVEKVIENIDNSSQRQSDSEEIRQTPEGSDRKEENSDGKQVCIDKPMKKENEIEKENVDRSVVEETSIENQNVSISTCYMNSFTIPSYSTPAEKPMSDIIIMGEEDEKLTEEIKSTLRKKAKNTLFFAAFKKPSETEETQTSVSSLVLLKSTNETPKVGTRKRGRPRKRQIENISEVEDSKKLKMEETPKNITTEVTENKVEKVSKNKEISETTANVIKINADIPEVKTTEITNSPNVPKKEETEEKITDPVLKFDSEDSDEEIPKRRVIPRKKDKNVNKQKRPVVKKAKLVTTHKKLKSDDANQIQITMSTTETPNKQTPETIKPYFESSKMTYRVIRRANFVIETVRQEKVIVDLTKLMKAIKEEEQQEGYNVAIDKKSLMRLIFKLSRDGYVKFRKATLKADFKEKTVCFICDPSIDDDHSVIHSALEQYKMKFFIGSKFKDDNCIEEKDLPKNSEVEAIELRQEAKETTNSGSDPKSEVSDLITTTNKKPRTRKQRTNLTCGTTTNLDSTPTSEMKPEKNRTEKYKYDKTMSKKYGYTPKFVRTRLIHEHMFHLIFGDFEEPLTDREEIEKLLENFTDNRDTFDCEAFCSVYHKDLGWKMFVPPLPKHEGWPRGWTLLSDVLLRLPLVLFVKCFNVPYVIPDIDEYLEHPVRKYFLVKNLPPKIRNGLLIDRRYIFAMYEIVTRLCHMGLLQFGPHRLKEKDQVFLYLNRKVTLLNTVTSAPSYHKIAELSYDSHQYEFQTLHDLERYWYELWSICINTNLGARNAVTGQFIVLEQALTKPKLVEACRPKTAEEAPNMDDGHIPGDRRGAAGLDSALFAHLKRNWNWNELFSHPQKKSDVAEVPKSVEKVQKVKESKIIKRYKVTMKGRQAKQKTIVRQVLPKRKARNRKPTYDEKDKECLRRMSKLRTDWTQIEDNVLLLCLVASFYLCPHKRRQNVEYTVIRDVLHKMVPYSSDKTSKACQRRLNYVMKNAHSRKSVQMSLEELRQCEYVLEKFGTITKKYQGHLIPVETLNIAFVELVAYLNKRFSNQMPKLGTEIPDTIKEIQKKYEISTNQRSLKSCFKDVETVDEVNFNTIRSVIHSSLCCAKDKTSYAFQLFKIYQQYSESLLRSVITKVRHDQMVSLKKIMKSRNAGVLPFSSPFQLSISYAYQLQNTRFCYGIFNEANTFLMEILEFLNQWDEHKEDDSLEIAVFDNGTALLMVDFMQKFDLEFKFEHPEQVIVLHPQITNDAAYERIVKRYNDILSDSSNINDWEDQRRETNDSDDEFAELDENLEVRMVQRTNEISEVVRISNRAELNENLPNIDETNEDVRNLNEPVRSSDFNSSIIRRSSSRIAFHMMRAEMCEGIDKNSAQHIHDFFVVNASKVFLEVPNFNKVFNITLRALQDEINVTQLLESIKQRSLVPNSCGKVTTEVIREHYPDIQNPDFEFIEKIKCYVRNRCELGATSGELKTILPDRVTKLTLSDILELLESLNIVLRVGTTEYRYVHFDYRTPWVVSATKVQKESKEKLEAHNMKLKGKHIAKVDQKIEDDHLSSPEVQKEKLDSDSSSAKKVPKEPKKMFDTSKWKGKNIISSGQKSDDGHQKIKLLLAPWIRLDGSLNRRVLDRWIGSVLSNITEEPGISLLNLTKRYDFLKPVEVIDLVRYLKTMKCVNLMKVVKSKVTLFSDDSEIDVKVADFSDDPGLVLLEPEADAVFKMAIFLGQKNYGVDFMN